MTIDEAKAECEHWLTYVESQKERSLVLQKLAARRRAGECNDTETRQALDKIDRDVVVYDGAKLADAVRVLIGHLT